LIRYYYWPFPIALYPLTSFGPLDDDDNDDDGGGGGGGGGGGDGGR